MANGANVLDLFLNGLLPHLCPIVDIKIRKLLLEENFSSWAEIVLKISQEVIADIIEKECGICLEILNKPLALGAEATINCTIYVRKM